MGRPEALAAGTAVLLQTIKALDRSLASHIIRRLRWAVFLACRMSKRRSAAGRSLQQAEAAGSITAECSAPRLSVSATPNSCRWTRCRTTPLSRRRPRSARPRGTTEWQMLGVDYVKAVEMLQDALGAPVYGLMIGQNGMSSTMNAWLPSALLGTKVVDAVGDIRAHPTGDMGSIGMAGSPEADDPGRGRRSSRQQFLHRTGRARRDGQDIADLAQGRGHVRRLHRKLPQSGARLLREGERGARRHLARARTRARQSCRRSPKAGRP